jgi:hypothetical protein
MVELKELLGQWKDLPQLMGMEDTLAPRLDKEGNRESFVMGRAHIQSSVEGHRGIRSQISRQCTNSNSLIYGRRWKDRRNTSQSYLVVISYLKRTNTSN